MPSRAAVAVRVEISNADQIEQVIAEVLRQEQSGQFNTVHHEVLANLLRGSVATGEEKQKEESKE